MALFDIFKKNKTESEKTTEVDTNEDFDLIDISKDILLDTKTDISNVKAIKVAFDEFSDIGGLAIVAEILKKGIQKNGNKDSGLYRIANQAVGDSLKAARDGNYWGALKTTDGKSKMAKLAKVDAKSLVGETNSATIVMAVVLIQIEHELVEIKKMEEQILSFLEEEKEANIEGDLKTLIRAIEDIKHLYNNEQYRLSQYNLVLNIRRSAEQNMIFYQKQLKDVIKDNPMIVMGGKVNSVNQKMKNKLMYYRLSLYTYSLASFVEVMLQGNYSKSYVLSVKRHIDERSSEYEDEYVACSEYLAKQVNRSVEKNVMKGIGNAENAVGKLLGNIPVVKKGQANEWLIEKGKSMKKNANNMEQDALAQFEVMSDPKTRVYTEKLRLLSDICNETTGILFDEKNVYIAIE